MAQSGRILVGEIGRPHGVRGLVKLRSFTADPAAIASYGPLSDEAGRVYRVQLLADDLARIDGIADRDAAQRLTGTKLYVARAALPPPEEDEFYLADLIGLKVETASGQQLGSVAAVEDHGGGAFLVLGNGQMLPFTRAVVPVVDIAAGKLVVEPPAELVVQPQPGEAPGEEHAA